MAPLIGASKVLNYEKSQNLMFINTLRSNCITHTQLHPTSVTVFNFTHHPVLSTLLLILSAARFLSPDSLLLFTAPFLSSVHQHGMTFPFFSDRNSVWTHSSVT